MDGIAAALAAEFGPRGYRVPTRRLSYWLMWIIARFDKTIGLALSLVGQQQLVTAGKAATDLGWSTRPAHRSIVDSAESLLQHGMVERSHASRTPQPA
jgi:dihydroflavonol-4-reductase